MKAVDTSVAVAAFGDWHRLNSKACALLDAEAAIPCHAVLETYSVLTGFPPPHRASPDIVQRWLQERFELLLAAPPPHDHLQLATMLAEGGRTGGSVYDGLIGLTAKLAGATLITADERAAEVYDLVGVEWDLL